ncbi:MAG TPA: fumarylacetoacetate hydrolase family protein [Casimicrobiaceae bacterium]|nr:fumarylacetoacetate hydrolase family protein [Casimicrobiaceae bacterium]
MKLVSYRLRDHSSVGAVVDGRVIDLAPALDLPSRFSHTEGWGMLALLRSGDRGREAVAAYLQRQSPIVENPRLADVDLLAPIPRPPKIVAIGRNYADHAAETGVKPFEAPRIIAKLSSSVAAPGSIVARPPEVAKLDYEIELAVIIGRLVRRVTRADALAAVAGYTIVDDVSAREFQFDVSPPQTTFAKSMDGFCPMGPWMVTRDEIADPQRLQLRTWVNGELVQDGNTGKMLVDVAGLIEYISRYMTLEPGDVIATGTPAGVGAFRKPPRYLQPGDRLRLEISGIGVLEHGIG